MDSHTVKSYDKDLGRLKNNITIMAKLVRDMIIITDKSVQHPDEHLINDAINTDKKINQLDKDIEVLATNIIALRQPMAIDLRQSIAALRIAVIMERIGDLSKNTSTRINKLKHSIDSKIINKIHNIANINVIRLEQAIIAYQKSDVEMAKFIYDKDQEVDKIYDSLICDLENSITQNPDNTKTLLQVIFASKNLERIGDYISKFASLISYISSGVAIEKDDN